MKYPEVFSFRGLMYFIFHGFHQFMERLHFSLFFFPGFQVNIEKKQNDCNEKETNYKYLNHSE